MLEAVISSSVIIIILLLIRVLFKNRMKNTFRYSLWLIAVLRLMLPFSLAESGISIMNLIKADGSETVRSEYVYEEDLYPEAYAYYDDTEPSGSIDHPQETYETYSPGTESEDKNLSPEQIRNAVRISMTAIMLAWFAAVNISFYYFGNYLSIKSNITAVSIGKCFMFIIDI